MFLVLYCTVLYLYSIDRYLNPSVYFRTDFSILESRPRPLGVATSSNTLAAAGVVSGLSGLVAGSCYYSDTMGRLVDSGLYYGQEPLTSDTLTFVESSDETRLISADSFIGVAISGSAISIMK